MRVLSGGDGDRMTATPVARDAPESSSDQRRSPMSAVVGLITTRRFLVVAVAAPFVAAIVRLVNDDSASTYDFALMEMQVRDVGTSHTPLVGLTGRLGVGNEVGHHPGPLGFYLMAVPYRLLGQTRWAIWAATLLVHFGALLLAVLLARRYAGRVVALGVALTGLLLAQAWGFEHLVIVWNPYVPWFVFFAFVVVVWLAVAGQWHLAPIAVFLGSVAAQTHIPYLPVCAVSMAALCAYLGVVAVRSSADDGTRRRAVRSLSFTAVTACVAWLPPVIQQIRDEHGNISLLVDRFTGDATEPAIGLGQALKELAMRADPWLLLVSATRDGSAWHDPMPLGLTRSPVPGAIMVVVWVALAIAGWRWQTQLLRALNITLMVLMAAAVIGASRIQGEPYPYLLHLLLTIAVFAMFATCWMVVVLASRAAQRWSTQRVDWRSATAVACTALLIVLSVRLTCWPDSTQVRSYHDVGPQTARLADQTVAELRAGAGAALPDAAGRYDLRLDYGTNDGLGEYFGLINDLDRAGIDVYAPPVRLIHNVGDHRVLDPSEATAELVLASEVTAQPLLDNPDAELIAVDDGHPSPDEPTFAELADDLSASLRRTYSRAEAKRFDANPVAYTPPPDIDDQWTDTFEHLRDALPTMYVFITPPSNG